MPAMWLDVDAALSEVPINSVALIDDTDFKTREESVVYNQSGLDLLWNFITSAGAFTQTAVTPTDTGGDYDWVNQGNGMYTIEIPASGGASINNDTEGYGWFSGFATGILPWSGPIIGFRAAALNNALCDGGDNLEVDLTHIMNTILTEGGAGRLKAAFVKLFDVATPTLVASSVMRGTDGANTTVPDAAGTAPTASEIQTEMEENGASLLDTIRDDLANATDGLGALKDLIDAVQTEVDKIGTIPALDGGGQTIGAAIAKLADDNGGADFDAGTDSLQEIRDRGDAAWAGAPEACSGTLTVQTADTVFNLTATSGTLWASDDDLPPKNMVIDFYDNSAGTYESRRITSYEVLAGPIYRVTVDRDLNFPGEDGVDTWVIYRNAYVPVGEASVSEADKNSIVDKVWDELDADHMTQGTKGLKMHHAGRGRYG